MKPRPRWALRATSRTTPSASELAAGNPWLLDAIRRSRKLTHRRALAAGVAGALPLPGMDWALDAAILTHLLPQINAEFGLSESQIDRLDAQKQEHVRRAIALTGSVVVGRVVTQAVVLKLARTLGVRLTAAQVSRFIPVAGQAVSGALGYAVLRAIAEHHIRDCVQIARSALPAPAPVETLTFK